MYSSKTKLSVLAAFILPITALLSGCPNPSLNQVRVFGTATSSLSDNSKKAFQLLNDSTIDKKMYDLAIDPSQYPTDEVFEGLLAGEALRVRIEVLDNLGSYATSLEKLASADFKKEIDEAATDLYGALSGLKKSYNAATKKDLGLSDGQMKIIATAVKVLGDAIIESKRRSAIKTIVIEADGAVQTVTKLLAEEFGDKSAMTTQIRDNLSNADGTLRENYNRVRMSSTFDKRYQMLAGIKKMYELRKSSQQLLANIHKGAIRAGKAHAALKKAVEEDKFTSEELVKELAELVFYARAVKQFHENL